MIDAAVDCLRRHGVAGMSFTEVLQASGAARGAIYHHFPGGKAQLVTDAVTANSEEVRATLAALPGDDPVEFVSAFLETVRPVAAAAAGGSGCAVAAVALAVDGPDQALRAVAQEGFGSWTSALSERLTTAGLSRSEATQLATMLVALLEGTQILTRAAADLEPFDRAAQALLDLVRHRYAK
jgi:TetR/AcrR family transcriptional repressor of lmrAB and yxaGH operons